MNELASPSSGRTLVGIAAASFALGMAAATLGWKPTGGDAGPRAQPVAAQPSGGDAGPGPRLVEDGIPSGFSRDRQGAIAAATGYVCTGQALLDMDTVAAEEAVRRMAAGASADLLAEETLAKLRAARETLRGGTGPIVFRQGVVAHRLEAFTPDRARVAVWRVGVLAREGVAPPQAEWAVSTFDLLWERDDWRIWAQTIVPGPAPILNDSTAPATASQLIAALDGFVDLGRAS